MHNTSADLSSDNNITRFYCIIEDSRFFLRITIDTEYFRIRGYELAQAIFDLLYTDSYRIYLVSMTMRTDNRKWGNLTTMVAYETLLWCRMIGECNITMRTFLIVTTISTYPCSCITSPGVEYEWFFSFRFDLFDHTDDIRWYTGGLEASWLEWDDGEDGWQLWAKMKS